MLKEKWEWPKPLILASGCSEKSFPYLGLYSTRTGEYSQNVEITGIPEDFAAITPTERLFEGMQDDELLSVRPVSDTGDEYVIIKYRFK